MKAYLSRRTPLMVAMGLALAMLALGFLAALGVRSLVAGTASASPAAPNPGHSWSEIGDLPGTMWHSNNDGPGSGLDADTLDGLQSTQIQDADDYVSNAGHSASANSASNADYATSAGNADTVDGAHASGLSGIDYGACQKVTGCCSLQCPTNYAVVTMTFGDQCGTPWTYPGDVWCCRVR